MKSTLLLCLLALGLGSGQAMANSVYVNGDRDQQDQQDQQDHRQDGDQKGDRGGIPDQGGLPDQNGDQKGDQNGDQRGDQRGDQYGDQQERCEPEHGQDGKGKGHQQHCKKVRFVKFNLDCSYSSGEGQEAHSCRVVSVFKKAVTLDGGEIADHSPKPDYPLSAEIPQFMVECDNVVKFNDHARRFTDLLSTRIQALTGSRPAIYLPRGSLHAGVHVADSYLEIEPGLGQDAIRMAGSCNIWTGRP